MKRLMAVPPFIAKPRASLKVSRLASSQLANVASGKPAAGQTANLRLDTNPRILMAKDAGSYHSVGEASSVSASSIRKAKASVHSSGEHEVASPFSSSTDQSWRVMGGE